MLSAGSTPSMFWLASSHQRSDELDFSSPSGDQTPIGPLLWTVFASILEVFLLCFCGWLLARRGIIDKKTQKQLNRINVSLFTPSLLFSKVAFSLSPQKLKELWIIPIFFVVVTGVSAAVAWLLSVAFRLKRTQRNFAIAAAMFNNSNSLPIALMQSLVITVQGLKWGKDDNKDSMLGRALSYLVLYSTLGMMLRWSYGVHLLAQADDEVLPDVLESDSDADITPSEDRVRHSVTFNLPGDEDDERTPLTPSLVEAAFTHANIRELHSDSDGSPVPPTTITAPPPRSPALSRRPTQERRPSFFYSFPNTPTRSRVDLAKTFAAATPQPTPGQESPDPIADLNDEWGGLPRGNNGITAPSSSRWESLYRRAKNKLWALWEGFAEFMTVPMWAALLSLVVACVKPFQHALQNHMQPVKGALVAAGNCSIPVTLVVLGAYFYTPPPAEENAGLTPALVHPHAADMQRGENGHVDGLDSRRRSGSHWSSSELSIATLTDNIREAIKMRVGGYKKLNSPSKKERREKLQRKGEKRTVFVAIVSRMLLAPALVLPAIAALAYWDLQRVTDDPVFVVSMVLLVSSPPALTLAQITQAASGDAFERLISKTIFWSYCIFTPPLTIAYVVIGLLLSKM
ncbi:hypothetical protein FRB90_007929 [Tulasnella sp. 427]|nr:hypothetical protein FRB90_007929 [Tulasnella sp. 427]